MKSTLSAVLFIVGARLLSGQDVLHTLVPPPAPVASGASVRIALVGLNPTAGDAPFNKPLFLAGNLTAGGRTLPVELQAEIEGPNTIRAGAFARRDYVFVLPRDMSGRVILEVAGFGSTPLRTVILAQSKDVIHPEDSPRSPAVPAPVASAAASIDRTFWRHFAAHEAIYFLYGSDAPAAKFQFSFKYRLRSFGAVDREHALRALQFGYTQRSLWDLNAKSSPFYDTSYIPSLFYESFSPARAANTDWLTWLGYQAGYQHESNGRAIPDSRSLNTLFFRRGVIIGSPARWHLIVSPKLSVYVGGLPDNPDLADYRGYAEWMIALGKGTGAKFTYTGRAGKAVDHFSTQLDFTIPMQSELLDFATYFTVQYFSGYSESLRTYNQRTESIRAGFSLVRLR
jgi:outer membrane phospholipase A